MRDYLVFLSHQRIKVVLSHLLNLVYHLSYFYSFLVTIHLKAKIDLSFFVVSSVILPCGDIAALVYLWNPFTIVSCVGLSTSPIENLAVILALFGAVTRKKMMILDI